ncbi:sigma-70 family RNA polymerase sigma factor [Paenibacillus sp. J5C_2022]|uniref:RNA polymerase sigma factor n=1 Tax=Paenibacillus sp. J5C2022 TaxID=2977129 RepID=UPI0021CF6D8D|nr:sigma-70 family RNA polymerase sigma factor [Paenibacillus sp. J5C2022]MCU6708258.1 sigma-70 family RNA polymerase sigma factor [Paenibacillus sp. J5C2022]
MNIEDLIELVKLHGKSIYGFCYKLTGTKVDTDDLYQDTFLKAMELRHKMDATRNPKAFLISIAVRLHRNQRRKLAWRQRIAPAANLEAANSQFILLTGEASPEDVVLSLELRTMIQDAAHRLNDKLKLPLYMYYTADMTVEEIAVALRIPPGTVKSRLHKARKTMREALEVDSP